MRINQTLLASGLFLLAAATSVPAHETGHGHDASTGIEFLLGGDQWQQGQRYRAGNDWLALVCQQSQCRFEPARLTVKKEQYHGHHDDEPTDGQKLTLRRQESGPGQALAWFRLDANQPWLTPGPVVTYAASTIKTLEYGRIVYSNARTKRPASEGTLELAVDLPDGSQATLVPLYDKANDNRPNDDNPSGQFVLQLRVPGKRQLLGAFARCPTSDGLEIDTGYLVWAGDLDGDGKPDYLINYEQGKLYLGKQAAPDEIVGVAGVSNAFYGEECGGC